MPSPIEEIKNRLDIVEVIGSYLKLKKAGTNYTSQCPFHSESKPSFFVSPSKQIWKCFGCGKGGGIFDFVMEMEGIEFGDALRILAQKAGVELKRERPEIKTQRQKVYETNELAAKFFQKQLKASSMGQKAQEYLKGRKINDDSILRWRLGYAPNQWQALSSFLLKNGFSADEIIKAGLASSGRGRLFDRFRGRIIFPIFDFHNQVIGFGGRVFEEAQKEKDKQGVNQAKYLNSPNTIIYDKSRTLYGLNRAKVALRKENASILVEGYTDVILSHQEGIANVVAVSGTALTPYQLNILKRYSDNLFLSFDMDIAGDSATKRGIDLAQKRGFNIKILLMPQDHDAADVLSRDPEQWKKIIASAKDIMDFYFETTLAKYDVSQPQGKKKAAETILPVVKRIPNEIVRFHWIQQLSRALGVREKDIEAELEKTKTEEFQENEKIPDSTSLKKQEDPLEKEFFLLVFSSQESLGLLERINLKIFSERARKIISALKSAGLDWQKLEEKLSPELLEYLKLLSLEKEVNDVIESPLEETKKCLDLIKKRYLKKERQRLQTEILEAEKQKDKEKLEALKQKFYQLTQKEI